MKNIYIDGLQIHTNTGNIGYAVHTPVQGLDMATIRLSSYEKIGEHGAFISNQLYGERLITLEGYIYAQDLPTFNLRRRALSNIIQINKDANSVPVPHLVQFTTMDDVALQFYGYLKSFKMDMTLLTKADFQLQLFCPDFSLDNQFLTTTALGTVSPVGGCIIPIIIPAVLDPAVGGVVNCVNNGDCDAYPIITLNGPLTDPIIESDTLNRFIALNLTLAVGESVVIDMKNKTIMKGTTPIFSDVIAGSNWFWLIPGSNLISLITSNTGDAGNASIAYRDAYLGI